MRMLLSELPSSVRSTQAGGSTPAIFRWFPSLAMLLLSLFALASTGQALQPDWFAKVVPPPARAGAAAVYDTVRGQAVMFGGTFPGGALTSQTWLFDGWKWSLASPAHQPTARTAAGIAFDPVLNEVILFGGTVSGGTGSSETWVWDGSDWTQLAPATTPSAMKEASMAADTARSRVVLVGNGQTWEWDGTNWTQMHPITSPSARTGTAIAYDAQRGYTILFSGVVGTTYPNDTWTWDGNNWTLVNMVGLGYPEYETTYYSMTYDAERRQVLIFGGGVPSGGGSYTYNATWAWDGLKWNQLTPNTWESDATHPLYRGGAVMVYLPLRRATVMYGGSRSGTPGTGDAGLDDTWIWDGTVWSPLTPVNRASANMVWDSSRSHAVMFGGFVADWSYNYPGDSFDSSDTWVWDGAAWTVQNSAHRPPARGDFAMAYDAARDRVLIFGGTSESYGHAISDLGDMWAWDGTDWTQLTPTTLPAARHGCRMAYDAANQRVVLFGGSTTNDTWVWDGTNWTQLSPATSPPVEIGFGLAYDPLNQRVMWAGFTHSYTFDATNNWTLQAGSALISSGEMAWDTALNEMVMYDGHALAVYNGSSWSALTPITTLPDHPNAAVTYDTVLKQLVLYGGGVPYTSSIGDTWVLTGPESTGSIYVATNLPGASYSIAGPSPQTGSGTSSSWSGAAPGSYTITYNSVSGYITPAPVTLTLAAGSSIAFTSGYGVLPGEIQVSSNVSSGFTITGTYGYSGAGTFTALSNVPAGTYTVHWLPVAGYATPAPQTQTLAVGGSITFGGTYALLATTCTLTVGTNLAGATFSVVGPATYNGSGTSYSQSNVPPGTYTITYGPVVSYLTPPPETKTVLSGGALVFTGTYQLGAPAVNVGWVLKTSAPSGRANFSAVYDEARHQIVMFGGTRGFDIGETWVYDGSAWTQKHPAHSPPAQQSPPMVYDPVNRYTVLSGAAGAVRDTWTWDGNDWTQLSPATTPSIEYPGYLDYPAMAYDAARAQTVRVNNLCSETWIWNGSNWSQTAAGPIPAGSAYSCFAAFDAARSQVVLVAEYEPTTTCCIAYGTWTWDGTTWTQKATVTVGDYYTPPTAVPVPAPMAYDAVRQKTVLVDPSGGTWLWDGTAWTKESPATSASARTNPGLVFDPVHSAVLMVGGLGTATGDYIELSNDIWAWSGTNWTQQAASPANPVRNGTSMVYDPARGETVLFGGAGQAGWPNDTWIWDGNVWTERVTAHSPHMRADLKLVYDAARQQVMLFGGDGQYVYLCDTWVWDGVDWTQKFPTVIPSNRRGNMMAYDSVHNVVVMFGGLGYSGALNDTWTWDGTNWTQMHPATSPTARQLGSMEFDPVRGRVVLFGGQDASNNKFGDTWVWDGTNWTHLAPANSPPARDVGAMAFDPLRGYMLLYGGVTSTSCCVFATDTWSWNGTNWTQQTSADTPPAVALTMTYDAARGKITTFGAWTLSHYFAEDVWVWDQVPTPPTTGTIFVNTNLASAGFAIVCPGFEFYLGTGTWWSQSNASPGSCGIHYLLPVSGYATPPDQNLTLVAGGAITFVGTYVSTSASLSVVSSHTGNFTQGQQNATYSVVVSNGAGAAPTSGTVTVTENIPSGLTLVSMAGPGWACLSNSCTRSDALAAEASYPAIWVTVNVGINATSPQGNQVLVAWGGTNSANMTDSTVITPMAPGAAVLFGMIASKTGTQAARQWTFEIGNSGSGAAAAAASTGVQFTQTAGAACTPIISVPASFPLALGNIPAGGLAPGAVTLNFTGCAAAAKFRVLVQLSANGGSATGRILRNDETR